MRTYKPIVNINRNVAAISYALACQQNVFRLAIERQFIKTRIVEANLV